VGKAALQMAPISKGTSVPDSTVHGVHKFEEAIRETGSRSSFVNDEPQVINVLQPPASSLQMRSGRSCGCKKEAWERSAESEGSCLSAIGYDHCFNSRQ
jgi:hypothetical protein